MTRTDTAPGVALEPLTLDHTQPLFQLTDTNRTFLREWLPWLDYVQSSDDTRQFIESCIAKAKDGGAPTFAILYQGTLCGIVGFHDIQTQARVGFVGYWLARAYNCKGIVTAAVAELLRIGFGQHNLNKIEVRCAERNHKSRAVVERLGFTYEATLRQCEWLYTHYVDHAVYSMLASEYRALTAGD